MTTARAMTIAIGVLAALTMDADTVTTRDSRSWNGNVTSIQNGVVKLNTAFPGGSPSLTFGAGYVRSIEFNTTTYNPGANPANLLPKPNSGKLHAIVYMRDKSAPHKCATDLTADQTRINCDGESLDRKNVLRISVDAK